MPELRPTVDIYGTIRRLGGHAQGLRDTRLSVPELSARNSHGRGATSAIFSGRRIALSEILGFIHGTPELHGFPYHHVALLVQRMPHMQNGRVT